MSLTFNLTKGLLYGITLGIIFAISIFIIGTVAQGMGFLPVGITAVTLAALTFGNGVLGGVTLEYGKWLKAQKNGGLIFGLTNGFLNGIVLGIYFGLSVYLLAGIVAAMGWLTLTAVQMAGLTFGVCILMFVTYEYCQWLDVQNALNLAKATTPAT